MPRLPFVVEPDEVDVVEVVAPLARVHAWAAMPPAVDTIMHRTSAAGADPGCEPVRDMDGITVHRIKVYDATELTCTVCGDTSTDGKCWNCGKGFDPAATPMVPMISYLNPDEYEFIRRTW
jgi:hypothetical protein